MDALGWVATGLFAASYFCKEPAALRRTQALAALDAMPSAVLVLTAARLPSRRRGRSASATPTPIG